MWLTRASREIRSRQITIAALAIAALAAAFFLVSGFAHGAEENLRDNRDVLRIAPASGEIVIVEIDARSLEEYPTWPWPRSYYAQAIEELDRLGADQIGFDVDFSARSNRAEDEVLAEAFAGLSQPALLPTFRQRSASGVEGEYSEALPIEEFREHTFVASVNVSPSADGRVTFYANGVVTNGMPRPSLANMLAGKDGAIDEAFRVDQAIDIESIPRISFVDVLDGRVTEEQVQGKSIVIGATAIELFDRYPTALFGVQPGVAVQVQAAETLIQDRKRADTGQILPLLLGILLLIAACWASRNRRSQWYNASVSAGAIGAVMVGAALILDQLSAIYISLASVLAFLATFVAVRQILIAIVSLEAERMTDTATGLPNRRAMERALVGGALQWVAAVRFDDFGEVLSILNTEEQARLDEDIARRLSLVASDKTVYRLDQGTFAWFIHEDQAASPDSGFAPARAVFNAPFEIGLEKLRLKPSFGQAKANISGAINAAESARRSGAGWSSDAYGLQKNAQLKQRIIGDLDEALTDGSITVVFQPKVALATGRVAGAECLVRWESEALGRLSPADFIPILEEKGRIAELTLFVLEEAIGRLVSSQQAGMELNVAVNISAQLLGNDQFIGKLTSLLERNDIAEVGGVTLEITESAPLDDAGTARRALEKLGEAGARISIDDYGTGQATLNYLQGFPAQELKLDQSFVRDLATDPKDRIMVQSTIDLAHALGFEVVGEGVEDSATLEILRELGCDYVQGWYTGRPVEWGAFLAEVQEVRKGDLAA